MYEKPVLAPIDGTLIKDAVYVPSDRNYQMCNRCVMDTTDPDITFDEAGVCSHCKTFDSVIKPNWPSENIGAERLNRMIETVKKYGANKQYDCILGISGGVDSSYLAVKVIEWGLRPLAVHVDAGWNTELAVNNIEVLCKKLDIDLVTHVIDWEDMRDMQLAFLRSNLANQDVPQDHAFFAALYHYANKSNIKYVIEGRNYATESILPSSWGYDAMDAILINDIQQKFGEIKNSKFPTVNFFDYYIKYPILRGMHRLSPLNLIPYNKSVAINLLEENYGWRYYGGKHYESGWTRFFQGYYLPHKFGYDKRKAHLSSMILAGEINREKALHELKKPLYDERLLIDDKEYISKKLGITVSELDELIKANPKNYTDYKNNTFYKKIYYKVSGIISGAKKLTIEKLPWILDLKRYLIYKFRR